MTTTEPNPTVPLDRDHPLLESIKGIKVIDVDTHLTEPGDLWTSRAPAKYVDLVPRVEYRSRDEVHDRLGWMPNTDQSPVWIVENDTVMFFAGGASVINKSNQKIKRSDFASLLSNYGEACCAAELP